MSEPQTRSRLTVGYHAHIYYDPGKDRAHSRTLCTPSASSARPGRGFRDEPVGPHPAPTSRSLPPSSFSPLSVAVLHRDGLDVRIHPLTDDLGCRPQPLRVVARARQCR